MPDYTPAVTNTVKRPDGTAAADAVVSIELAGDHGKRVQGFVTASDYSVEGLFKPTVNSSGVWSQALVPNTLISPSGTVWKVTERVDGVASVYYLTVTNVAGPLFVEDILAEPPTAVPSPALVLHMTDPTDAHDASAISFNPAAGIGASDVQAAIVEAAGDLTAHLADAVDAHDASAVSFAPTSTLAATDVQAAIVELESETTRDFIVNTLTARDALTTMEAGSFCWVRDIDRIYHWVEDDEHTGNLIWKPLDELDYINILDYGAFPNVYTAPQLAANDAAIAACIAKANARLTPGFRTRTVLFPSAPTGATPAGATTYGTGATISASGVQLTGTTGSYLSEFADLGYTAIDYRGPVGTGDVPIVSVTGGFTHITKLNLASGTTCRPIWMFDKSHVAVTDCYLAFDNSTNANRACIHVANSFWVRCERTTMAAYPQMALTHGAPVQVALLITAETDPTYTNAGLCEGTFRDITMQHGIIVFENRLLASPPRNDSTTLEFTNVVQENTAASPFIELREIAGGPIAHGVSGVSIKACVRADSANSGESFVRISGGSFSCYGWDIENCYPYCSYVLKQTGGTLANWHVSMDSPGKLFDPTCTGNVVNWRHNEQYGECVYYVGEDNSANPNHNVAYEVRLRGEATGARWNVRRGGEMWTAPSSATMAAFVTPPGVAQTSNINDGSWTFDNTNTGLKVRVNGVWKTVTLT